MAQIEPLRDLPWDRDLTWDRDLLWDRDLVWGRDQGQLLTVLGAPLDVVPAEPGPQEFFARIK